jgi:hypothetical protein
MDIFVTENTLGVKAGEGGRNIITFENRSVFWIQAGRIVAGGTFHLGVPTLQWEARLLVIEFFPQPRTRPAH